MAAPFADDLALAQLLKRHGARPMVVNAVGAVRLDFYRDLAEMAVGMEKSGFAVIGRYSPVVMGLVCVVGLALEAGFLRGFLHPALWVQALTAATVATARHEAKKLTAVRAYASQVTALGGAGWLCALQHHHAVWGGAEPLWQCVPDQ